MASNNSQLYVDKLLAMVMLADAICRLVGESIRDAEYAQVIPDDLNLLKAPELNNRSREYLFSGSFPLLKQRLALDCDVLSKIVDAALRIFAHLVYANVRSLVPT